MIVFESDEVQAIYEPGDSDFLLITFGAIAMRPNGRAFFGQPVTQAAGISALGFMAKRPNWYPSAAMRLAKDALGEILLRHKNRVMFGYSMGAYGAIKFSGLFGARTCVAISPQFSIDPNDVAAFDRSYNHFFSDKLHAGMAVRKEDCPEDVFILYDNRYSVDIRHMALYKKAIDPFLINVPFTGHETMRCFTGTKVATTLFDLCRERNLTALDALARMRRKPHPIRAFRLCLELAFKHPVWADQILRNRADDMLKTEVHEVAVRIGQGAARRNMPELAERVYLHALSLGLPNENRALAGLADLYLQRGDTQKAVETARQAIAVNQADIGIRAWLCSVLVRIGRLEKARLEAEAGLALAADHVPFLASMANIAENQGRLDEAVTWARRAAASGPDRLYFGERLVHLLVRCGNWESARSEATKLIEEHPSHVGLLRCLADISDHNGRTDEALEWMHRAVMSDPGNVHLRERMAHLHMRAEDFPAAEQVLIAALEINPGEVSLLRCLSDVCGRQGRSENAMSWMLKASAAAPDNVPVKEAIVHLAIRSGDFRKACGVATEALGLDPGNVRLMQCLADAHERLSEYAKAGEWLKTAVAADGSNLHLRERLVYLAIRTGDFDSVRDFAVEAINLDPRNTNMMRCLSDAHERLSEMTDAVLWAHKAVTVDTSNLHLRERLAHMLIVANDAPAAEQVLLGSLEINPAHFGTLRYMADIMLRRRRLDQAVAYAERATEAGPAVAWFREWFAGLLLAVGDADAADVQIREGLRLTPDNPQLLRRSVAVQAQLAQPRPWVAAVPDDEVVQYFEYWQRRHANLLQTMKTAQPRVLFMGDSVTEQWSIAGEVAWNQYFVPLGSSQTAISNERTQTLLWRIVNGAIDGIAPDHVVLLIGTNNIGRNRAAETATGIEQVWTEIQTRLPDTRLLALAILPRDSSPESWHRIQVNQINNELKLRAEQRGIAFLDLADCLLESDGTLSPDIAPDGIHLSAAGYQQIAPRISEKLAELRRLPHPNPYSTSAV
jgi:tetratricopeptide (TPR) repeat protein/lysophospholipase L1-like esterase